MPFSPISGIIFDLDGTLADTLPLCFASFARVFERYAGRALSRDEIEPLFGPSEEGIIRGLVPDRWEAALEEYLEFYQREHAHYGREIDGIADLLAWLARRRTRVGIVTGKGSRSGEISLRELGLAAHVSAIRYGSPLGGVKPYAIRDMLDEWMIPPERAAYVGDSPSDMLDATCSGVSPIGAAWAPGSNPAALRAAGALYVFTTPSDLQTWLSGEPVDAAGLSDWQTRGKPVASSTTTRSPGVT